MRFQSFSRQSAAHGGEGVGGGGQWLSTREAHQTSVLCYLFVAYLIERVTFGMELLRVPRIHVDKTDYCCCVFVLFCFEVLNIQKFFGFYVCV